MRRRPDWSVAWLLPALAGLALVFAVTSQANMFDAHFYVEAFADGTPGWTATWPYPPLAALPALATLLDTSDPNRALVLLVTVPVTAATLAMLWLARGPYRVLPVLFFSAGVVMLAWSYANRLDPLSVCLSVAGLLAVRAARPVLAGVLLGLGGLVKLWPVALLVGAATWRRWRTVTAGLVTAAAVAVLATLLGGADAWGWLRFGSGRSLEAESLVALPGLWARALGSKAFAVSLDSDTASAVISGPGLNLIKWAWIGFVGAVLIATTFRARRELHATTWTSAQAGHALALVVGLMLCLPVLSPQYMCWPLAVIAVALVDGWQRRIAVSWIAACALTTIVFPLTFVPLMYEGSVAPLLVLTLRDLLILGVFAGTVVPLWLQPKTAT